MLDIGIKLFKEGSSTVDLFSAVSTSCLSGISRESDPTFREEQILQKFTLDILIVYEVTEFDRVLDVILST